MDTLSFKDIIIFKEGTDRYLYHTSSGLIFNVTDSSYDYLENLSDFNVDTTNDIHQLLIASIQHYGNKLIPQEHLPYKPSCLVLNISGQCNLKCPYCFSQGKHGFKFKSMSLKTCLDSVKYLIESNPDRKDFTIGLFGGEPFLEYQLIETLLRRINESYPDYQFTYSITTNGTVINERILKVLKKYNTSLIVSLDGPKQIANTNRPNKNPHQDTFEMVMRTSQILKENKVPFVYRATVTADNMDLMNTILFFEQLETPYYIVFCFESSNENSSTYALRGPSVLDNVSEQIDKVYSYYYAQMSAGKKVWGYYFLEKLISLYFQKRYEFPCGAGNTLISVTDNGDIFACMNYAPMLETRIGNIYSSIDEEAHNRYMSKPSAQISECEDCILRYTCSGGCIAERCSVGNINRPNAYMCELNKLIFKKDLIAFQHIKKHHYDFLKGLITTFNTKELETISLTR